MNKKRRTFSVAAIALSAVVISTLLIGDSSVVASPQPSPEKFIERQGDGGHIIKAPVIFTMCGLPMILVEPNGEKSTKVYAGKRMQNRLKELKGTPILVNEMSKAYPGMECSVNQGHDGSPMKEPVPRYNDPNRKWYI